jgi:hypothetical protein
MSKDCEESNLESIHIQISWLITLELLKTSDAYRNMLNKC